MRRAAVGNCEPWEAPSVGPRQTRGATRAELERLHAQAKQEGYDAGFASGRDAGLADSQARIRDLEHRLIAMIAALEDPLQAADEAVIDRIARLSISLARRLVRRELRTSRDEVVGVVREALSVLPVGLREVRLHLHPEDARLVREALAPPEGSAAWQIVEDPVISRGGCRISSQTSQVDATLETRFNRVINSMLGDERNDNSA